MKIKQNKPSFRLDDIMRVEDSLVGRLILDSYQSSISRGNPEDATFFCNCNPVCSCNSESYCVCDHKDGGRLLGCDCNSDYGGCDCDTERGCGCDAFGAD